jgi:transposase InsO family protein
MAEVEKMSRRVSASAKKPYGVRRVCKAWEISASTFYAWLKRQQSNVIPLRRGPQGPLPDEDLVSAIKDIIKTSPFTAEGYRKIWAKLRFRGIRTSKERVRRLLREHNLLAPVRKGSPKGPRNHDGKITTTTPNVIWGTDMTTTILANGRQVSVFVAVDHYGLYCVGLHATERGTRWEALEPIRQGVREHFGGFDKSIATSLKLRHDHGSQYMSKDFQNEINFLGIESSPSFVRAPEGNGCAERFIGILKENLLWPRTFETIEELRDALIEFKEQFNHHWLLNGFGYKTPAQVRMEAHWNTYDAAS